ncbi:hypothetical protein FACS189479_04370 [Spirochaetia bacterium]|nr:hypothetical protein FACS189479_04370 [Spirochaetia bacterium]
MNLGEEIIFEPISNADYALLAAKDGNTVYWTTDAPFCIYVGDQVYSNSQLTPADLVNAINSSFDVEASADGAGKVKLVVRGFTLAPAEDKNPFPSTATAYSFRANLMPLIVNKIQGLFSANADIVNKIVPPDSAAVSGDIADAKETYDALEEIKGDYVKLESATTQIIKSDLAIGFGKKVLFEESDGGPQHLAIDRDQWGVEVGNEEDPMILNTSDVDGDIAINWKDGDGVQQAGIVAKKSDVAAILNDTDAGEGSENSTYTAKKVNEKISAMAAGNIIGLYDFGRAKSETVWPTDASVPNGATGFDFTTNTPYAYDGTSWTAGTAITPGEYNEIKVLKWLDGDSNTGVPMAGLDGFGTFVGTEWVLWCDAAGSAGTYDNDTIKPRTSDGALEVAEQAFTITEDSNKFSSGATLTFKGFWQGALNKVNWLFTKVGTLFTLPATTTAGQSLMSTTTSGTATWGSPLPTLPVADTEVKHYGLRITVDTDGTTSKDWVELV